MIRNLLLAAAIVFGVLLVIADVQRLEARIEAQAEREHRAARADMLLGVERRDLASVPGL